MNKKVFLGLVFLLALLFAGVFIVAQSHITWIKPLGSADAGANGGDELFSADQLVPDDGRSEPPPIPEDKPIVCSTIKQCLAGTGKKFSSKMFD